MDGKADILEKWGLPDHATDDQVRSVYRLLVQKHHPDRSDSPSAVEDFMLLQEEYRQIKTVVGRRAVLARRCAPDVQVKVKSNKKEPFVVPATNVIARVNIEPKVSIFGGTINVKTKTAVPCHCTTKGRPSRSCKMCTGTGQIFNKKELGISIPPGTPPGKPLKCKGAGNKGTHESGDLIVIPQWENSNNWNVDGKRLVLELAVPPSYEIGGQLIFTHANGCTDKVNVPPILGDSVVDINISRSSPHIGGFSGATIKAFIAKDAATINKFRMDQAALTFKNIFRNIFGLNKVKLKASEAE